MPYTLPADTVPAARPRVLVVDDTPYMPLHVAALLGDECEVLSAADGELAWAMLQRTAVDVVISDLLMPNLDGIGLAARIKSSPGFSHLPVIVVTAAAASDASVVGALEGGADDYVAKPFSPAELKARVRAALRMGRVQAALREQSRRAGMAEIATNVLHNVGNVVNSINIAAGLAADKVRHARHRGLAQAAALLQQHAGDLGGFMTADARGRELPGYLAMLARVLDDEQQELLAVLDELGRSVDHVKEIVATQQSYAAAPSVVMEAVSVAALVDDALRMNAGALQRHQIEVVKQVDDLPPLPLDKHRVLLILINLVSNAKYACDPGTAGARRITIEAGMPQPDRLLLRVADNGVGFAPAQRARIFQHGYTTRAEGHGFGLHSCAVAAHEMGGTLQADSEGPGRGAAFTLELPVAPQHGRGVRARPEAAEVQP